jgi:valyl-tRNA synthetase
MDIAPSIGMLVRYQAALEQNEFSHALAAVDQFFWNDFCDNYLELIKNQLFNPDKYAPEIVPATKATLHHVGLRILQMYAPYLPYVTEAIYEALYKEKSKIPSVHQTKFATTQTRFVFAESAGIMTLVLAVIGLVRKLKTERQLSLKTELATLTIRGDAMTLEALRGQEQIIKGVSQAITVRYEVGTGDNTIEQTNEAWHITVSV